MATTAVQVRRDRFSKHMGFVIGLGLLCVAGFFSLFGFMLWDWQRDINRQAEDSARNILRAIEQDIGRTFELYDLSLQSVTEHLKLPDLAGLSPEVRRLLLFDRATDVLYLNTEYVTDSNGRVTESSRRLGEEPPNFAGSAFFEVHRRNADVGLFVSKPYIAKYGRGDWVVALSHRINNDDGSFRGIVAGTISLEYFSYVFQQLKLGTDTIVMLHGEDGVLVMSHPFSRLHIGLSEPEYATDGQREGEYRARSTIDGVDRMMLFRRIGNLPLVASIGLSVVELDSIWRNRVLPVALTLLALTALTLLLGLLLARELRIRKKAEAAKSESEKRYRLISERSSDAIVLRSLDDRRIYASPAYFKIIGHTAEQFEGIRLSEILSDDCRHLPHCDIERLLGGEDSVTALMNCRRGDGTWIWIETVSTLARDDTGKITGIVSNVRNVTRRKLAEDRLTETASQLAVLAMKDALTGLDNRRSFDEHIERAWRRSLRRDTPLALLMIDVDHFKAFNDQYGHVQGDAALRSVADSIDAWMRRDYDLAARYGGEEFAVLLPETNEAGAWHIAENIRATVMRHAIPHLHSPHGLLTLSIGIATLSAKDSNSPAEIVLMADTALYRAKALGRNRVERPDAPASEPAADPLLAQHDLADTVHNRLRRVVN